MKGLSVSTHSRPNRAKYYASGRLPDGRRFQGYFRSRQTAEDAFSQAKMDAQDLGPEWGRLNAREKVELVQLRHQLHEHGIAVQEAHAALVQLLKGKLVPLDTEKAAEAYVEALGKKRLRPSYLKTQRNRVKMLADRFAGRPVHEISLPDLESWLHSMPISPRYFANLKLSWRTFFNWCLKRHHVQECVASKLEVPAADEKEPGILPPELVEQLLHRLQQQAPEHVPFFAIGFFAGCRPDEIRRLDWSAYRPEEGLLSLAAAATKGRRRRLVPVEPALRAWLDWSQQNGGKMPDPMSSRPFVRCRDIGGVRQHWTPDCMRHSYASYMLAGGSPPSMISLNMGHQCPETLFSNYKALVTPAAADFFWSIRPVGQPMSNNTKNNAKQTSRRKTTLHLLDRRQAEGADARTGGAEGNECHGAVDGFSQERSEKTETKKERELMDENMEPVDIELQVEVAEALEGVSMHELNEKLAEELARIGRN